MSQADLPFEEIKQRYLTAESTNNVAAMEAAAIEFEALATFEGRMWAHQARGSAFLLVGQIDEAHREFMQRLAALEPRGPSLDLLNTWTGLGRVAMYQDDMVSALEAFQRAMELAELLDLPKALAGANSNVGIVLQRVGDYAGALPYLQRGLQLSRQTGHRQFEANITNNIGMLYLSMDQPQEALAYFRQAADQLTELGSLHDVLGIQCNIGQVLWRLGDPQKAETVLQTAIDRSLQTGASHIRADLAVILAQVYLDGGRTDDAIALMDQYTEEIASNQRASLMAARDRAGIQLMRKQFDEAREGFALLLRRAEDLGHVSAQMDLHMNLRDLAKETKDFEAYIRHSEAYQRIKDQVNGADAARRYAVQEKQADMDALRQQQQREREVLYGALPRSIADRLVRGEDVNDHYEHAAVLVLDLVGFTAYSGSRSPQEVVALLGQIFESFDRICADHHVTKVKTIGDAYLAVAFPLGDGASSVEERAALAALQMTDAVEEHPGLRARIGLHSGAVSTGVIGKDRLQYDVWGEAVSIAHRMESTGEPGRIQVSSAFAEPWLLHGSVAGTVLLPRTTANSQQLTANSSQPTAAANSNSHSAMPTYWLESDVA